jgi:hypothetical protein
MLRASLKALDRYVNKGTVLRIASPCLNYTTIKSSATMSAALKMTLGGSRMGAEDICLLATRRPQVSLDPTAVTKVRCIVAFALAWCASSFSALYLGEID